MRIIAIDPGYERLGLAVLKKQPPKVAPFIKGDYQKREVLLYSACIKTAKELPHAERLLKISDAIAEAVKKHKPKALAIETLFLHTNQKTAMRVAEARGAILTEAARAGLPVFEYSPLQIKIAVTGYGRSEKYQVTEMVKKLIALPEKERLDDEYDAIAVGLTCLASIRINKY